MYMFIYIKQKTTSLLISLYESTTLLHSTKQNLYNLTWKCYFKHVIILINRALNNIFTCGLLNLMNRYLNKNGIFYLIGI